jgi:hypothetical protein
MTGAVLYVYYKVALDQHAHSARQVRAFQAALLLRWPGLVAELLQRPELSDGKETWMETYRHANGMSSELQQSVQHAALDAGLPAPRHTEHFIPLR